MRKKIKEAIQVYNNTPFKLNPAIFVLGIFFLLIYTTGVQIKENAPRYISYTVGSIMIGTIIDYLISMRRNREYYADLGRKQAVRVAYAIFATVLIILTTVLTFMMDLVL